MGVPNQTQPVSLELSPSEISLLIDLLARANSPEAIGKMRLGQLQMKLQSVLPRTGTNTSQADEEP